MNKFIPYTLVFVFLFGFISLSHAQQDSTDVILAGYKVNPPVNTSGSGSVYITVQGDSLFVSGSFSNLNSLYRGSGIHHGDENENGSQVMALTADLDDDVTSGTYNRSENGFRLTTGLRQALEQGMLYVNIYTQLNPMGELRGQIPSVEG